jgi:hypothetical protein
VDFEKSVLIASGNFEILAKRFLWFRTTWPQ